MGIALGRLKALLVVGDAVVALVASLLASALRGGGLTAASPWWPAPFGTVALVAVAALWPAVLLSRGAYRPLRLKSARAEGVELLWAAGLFAFLVLALSAVLHAFWLSRLFLGLFFVLLAGVTLIERALVHRILAWLRRRGRNARQILIVGEGTAARGIRDYMEAHPELGVRVAGFVADGPQTGPAGDDDAAASGPAVLGPVEALPEILARHVVDEVVVSLSLSSFETVERAVAACHQQGKNVYLSVDRFLGTESAMVYGGISEVGGLPLFSLSRGTQDPLALMCKRVIDFVVAAAVLVVASPVLLLAALAVALDSPGPAIFRQQRVGLHGRPFTLYKFRTMVLGAEGMLDEVRTHNEMQGPAFKIRNDPRVTRVGRLLRRSSLDELPQLWNVLRGDMSLVGPRPPLPDEVAQYDSGHRRRLSVRPGLTGLWQVRGRTDLAHFDRWMELDLEYIDRWSLWLDLEILLRTIPEVLALHGQ